MWKGFLKLKRLARGNNSVSIFEEKKMSNDLIRLAAEQSTTLFDNTKNGQ